MSPSPSPSPSPSSMPHAPRSECRKSPAEKETSTLIDISSVARILGVTPRHIQRLVAERRIPFLKIGRFVRFDRADLDVWLNEQRRQVRSPVRHAGTWR
jgi:excisionase family DNA binding protein